MMRKVLTLALGLALLVAPAWAQTTPLPPSLQSLQDTCVKILADIAAAQAAVVLVQADIVALAAAQTNLPQTPTESLDGTQVKDASTTLTDAQGNIWGLNAAALVLENGNGAYRGWQSHLLVYHNHTIFILGLDGNWYQWNGSTFVPGPKPL